MVASAWHARESQAAATSVLGRDTQPRCFQSRLSGRARQVRHGAMLGVAELVAALAAAGHALGADRRAAVTALVPAAAAAGLFRGKGGELMRAAVARCARGAVFARVGSAPWQGR